MPKCVYCGNQYDIPKGLTLVMNDGTVKNLCSSKCRKNMLMKRRKVRWISKLKKAKEEIREEIRSQTGAKEEKPTEKTPSKEEKKSK